ncbi:hypothetical protein [Tenacibaculum sp. M341]|uniref:hypothetical protein n=1 Tax=Tenacibaculum sp. M341 TaxID=2530339 RepID=UPI0010519C40|nr:hypothetical protein [Tenacibaculum sp. M341]TCI90650.1 hypothetical protein EYW44_13070 [Tenacibaculum sp. M341]
MGENKHIDELDSFAKKYMNDIESEIPSMDFTKNIMTTIEATETSKVFKTEPLISKKVWLLLVVTLIASIFYVYKKSSTQLINLPKIEWDLFSKIKIFNAFKNIEVSNVTLYACFFFTLLIFVQISFLKNRFEKRLKF